MSQRKSPNRRPMPLHFYSNPRVLKAEGLASGSVANLGALEALKLTYNVSDHVQQPLRLNAPNAAGPVVMNSSSEEDEVTSPLQTRYLPLPMLSFLVAPFIASLLTWADSFRPRPSNGRPCVTSPSVVSLSSQETMSNPPQRSGGDPSDSSSHAQEEVEGSLPPADQVATATLAQVMGPSPLATKGPLNSRKRMRSPSSNLVRHCPRRGQTRLPFVRPPDLILFFPSTAPWSPCQGSSVSKKSSTDPSHEEMISSLSTLGDKFFELQGVRLRSYMRLLTSFEEASGSSSRISQLEQDLRALRREKAREEGALQRRLTNLTRDHVK
ncbi:hypothetical protein LIER_41178 [Lithospermum erythrorhizon]|uniref:Uncharacterized protein n=1 Tax=Lithospermum erythrorhizon TaxID=34254 RepID=A0AAV3R8W5_LITER